MCQAAFADLSTDATKVVVSDAEYQSWKYAVRNMYVLYGNSVATIHAHSTAQPLSKW
jgi:hypothetical protein